MAGTKRRKRRMKMIFYYPIVAAIVVLGVVIFASSFEGGLPMVQPKEDAGASQQPDAEADALVPEEPMPDISNIAPPPESPAPEPAGNRLLPYRSNGRWGYKNTSGQIVIQARFSDAYEFDGNVAIAAVNNTGETLFGLIDRQGKWIAEPQWQDAARFTEGLAAVKLDGRWGYVDVSGNVAVNPEYEQARPFSDGRACVKQDGKWGYIDPGGALVIKADYESATDFSEGLAFVIIRGPTRRLIIDTSGETAATLKTAQGTRYRSKLAAVRLSEKKYGYVGTDGKLAFDTTFQEASDFSEGLAPVKKDDKWYYINAQGLEALPERFEDAKPFSEGLAAVKPAGKYGYIDANGQMVLEALYDEAEPFTGGYALVRRGPERGVIDRAGIFKLLYADTEP